jgi:hypothetical protein
LEDIFITEVIEFGGLLRRKVNLSSQGLSRNQFMTMSTKQLLINALYTDNTKQSRATARIKVVGGLCALLLSGLSTANDYKVEVLVFENINASTATESHAYEPPKLMRSASNAWLIEPTMLIDEAISIEESSDYQLQHHYSWGIESLPYEESANYTIVETDSQGYIKIYADLLLFTNIDLDYKGFRMKENRRLKLNEKHFFDHPKFGLLMQVSRLPKEDEETEVSEQKELLSETE